MNRFKITYKYPTGPEFVAIEALETESPQDAHQKMVTNVQRYPYLSGGQVTVVRVERIE